VASFISNRKESIETLAKVMMLLRELILSFRIKRRAIETLAKVRMLAREFFLMWLLLVIPFWLATAPKKLHLIRCQFVNMNRAGIFVGNLIPCKACQE
jgi:hypothetical protein